MSENSNAAATNRQFSNKQSSGSVTENKDDPKRHQSLIGLTQISNQSASKLDIEKSGSI